MANFALRLPDDLKREATKLANASGVSLNQFISNAVASKVAADKTALQYYKARQKQSTGQSKDILERSGINNSPRADDL